MCSFCTATLLLHDFGSINIWSKFSGTNSFKNAISLISLLKWLLYATLLLFLFDRTLFLQGASSLSLRDRKVDKISNKKQINFYQLPKQKTSLSPFISVYRHFQKKALMSNSNQKRVQILFYFLKLLIWQQLLFIKSTNIQ